VSGADWFGALRSLLQQPPSGEGWRALCALLEEDEVAARPDIWLEYAADLLDRGWPDALRLLPNRWLWEAITTGRAPEAAALARAIVPLQPPSELHVERARLEWDDRNDYPMDAQHARALARWPLLSHMTHLTLSRLSGEDGAIDALLASPHLGAASHLTLHSNAGADRWLQYVLGRRALRELDLRWCAIGSAGAASLVEQDMPALTTLTLSHNKIGHLGLSRLMQQASERLPALATLQLDYNESADDQGGARVMCAGSPTLRKLDLSNCKLGPGSVLFDGAALPALESLVLSWNPLGDEALGGLFTARLPRLRALSLVQNKLSPQAWHQLGHADLPALTTLVLATDDATRDHLDALAATPLWRQLTTLNLNYQRFELADLTEVLRDRPMPNLARLELRGIRFTNEQLKGLLTQASLDGLRELALDAARFGLPDPAPLVASLRPEVRVIG
jgi:hypothetical protein